MIQVVGRSINRPPRWGLRPPCKLVWQLRVVSPVCSPPAEGRQKPSNCSRISPKSILMRGRPWSKSALPGNSASVIDAIQEERNALSLDFHPGRWHSRTDDQGSVAALEQAEGEKPF